MADVSEVLKNLQTHTAMRVAKFLSDLDDYLVIEDFDPDYICKMLVAATPVVLEHALKGNL